VLSKFKNKTKQVLNVLGGVSLLGVLWWGIINSNKNILVCIFGKEAGTPMQNIANSMLNWLIDLLPTLAIIIGTLGFMAFVFVLIHDCYESRKKKRAEKLTQDQFIAELNNLIDKYKHS